MKDLIKQALTDAFIILEKRVPQTKNKTILVGIEDVNPLNIVQFMTDNNIPDNAWFGGRDNGYDAFSEVCLCYDVKIPTTDKDKYKFRKDIFSNIAFKHIYDLLIKSGYTRVGFNSGQLKEFSDTTLYDMFTSNDFDRLVKYYSLSFILM